MNFKNQFADDPSHVEFGTVDETVLDENNESGADQPAKPDASDDSDNKPDRRKNHDQRRWDKLFGKLEETTDELSELRQFKQAVESGKYSSSNNEPVPEHFKKMYEDGISMEERWRMQRDYDIKREEEFAQKAEERVLSKITAQQKEQTKWEGYIDDNLESLEENYDIDFTSGSAKAEKLKKDFLRTVYKLSPKDEQGNVVNYAPFDDVFDEWSQARGIKKDNATAITDRKKDIASLGGNSRPVQGASQFEAPESTDMWGWKKNLPDS